MCQLVNKIAHSKACETFWRLCNLTVTNIYLRLNIRRPEALYTKVKMSGLRPCLDSMAYAKGLLFPFRRGFLLVALGLFVSGPARAVPPGSVNYFFDPGITRYQAYDYVTDFQGWSSNDLWQNNGFIPVDVPNITSGQPTTYSPGQASAFGGVFMFDDPMANGPYVSRSELKFTFNPQGNTQWRFRWVQNLANGNPDDSIRDTFGWTLFSTANSPILTLKFNNGDFLGRDTNNYNTMVTALRGDITSSINAMPDEMDEVLFNRAEWVSFDLNVDTVADTWSATIGSVNNPVNSYLMEGVLNILAGTELGAIAQIWDLENSSSFSNAERELRNGDKIYSTFTGAGANTMLLESLSVQGVPEPSSASLVLISSLALLAARRRRQPNS